LNSVGKEPPEKVELMCSWAIVRAEQILKNTLTKPEDFIISPAKLPAFSYVRMTSASIARGCQQLTANLQRLRVIEGSG